MRSISRSVARSIAHSPALGSEGAGPPVFAPVSLLGDPRAATHEVFRTNAGYWLEDALAANGIQDAGFSNAGAEPNGWGVIAAFSPATTVTFTRTGIGKGKLRFQSAGGGDVYYRFGNGQNLAIATGDKLAMSFKVRLSAGDLTNITSISKLIYENDASGNVANLAPVSEEIQLFNTDAPGWEQYRLTAGNYPFASGGLKIINTGAFDVELEIEQVQLEKRDFRTTFAVAARSADDVGHALPAGDWTVRLQAAMARHNTVGTLWEAGDGDDRITVRRDNYDLYLTVVSGGATLADELITRVPPLFDFKLAISKSATGVVASINGSAPAEAAVTPPNPTTAKLGRGADGAWNSSAQAPSLLPAAMDASAIQVEAAVTANVFDDLRRADSATIGVSTSGHEWTISGTDASKIEGNKWKGVETGGGPAYATYGRTNLGRNPKYMGALFNWDTGASLGAFVLMGASNGGVSPLNAVHASFTDASLIYQTIHADVVQGAIATYALVNLMSRDGATRYGSAWLLDPDGALVYCNASGALVRLLDPSFVADNGDEIIVEHFKATQAQCWPEFESVAAF